MPRRELVPKLDLSRDDVQQTTFAYDVVPRYTCNTWPEIVAAQGPGSYPFAAAVTGGGMYGAYIAEKLYCQGGASTLRVLLLEAGASLLRHKFGARSRDQPSTRKVFGHTIILKADEVRGVCMANPE